MRKFVTIVIVLLLVSSTLNAQALQSTEHVGAADGGISPQYLLITSIHGNTAVIDGKVHFTGTVSGDCTYSKVTITLQYFSGGKWRDDITRSATGTKSATKSASKTATPGMIYRTKIYGYVSDGSVSDSDTLYTKVVGA